jgi:hypothetical protein
MLPIYMIWAFSVSIESVMRGYEVGGIVMRITRIPLARAATMIALRFPIVVEMLISWPMSFVPPMTNNMSGL